MLTFQNPGEIDIRGATIAGLSAKPQSSTPIGKFGTGLKYVIAQVLANGGQIVIWSGIAKHEFRKVPIDFRGSAHEQIEYRADTPDSQWLPVGITTHYGAHWLPWQIFRELYANARDEGGDVTASRLLPPTAGQTTIHITNWPELTAEYWNRNEIILPANTAPIIAKESRYCYYRGVRVAERIGACTFNISQELELTEDRSVVSSYLMHRRIAAIVQQCTDSSLIRRQLMSQHEMDKLILYTQGLDTSPEFDAIALELYRKDRRRYGFLKDFAVEQDPDLERPPLQQLTAIQQRMLDKAITICQRFDVDARSANITVRDLGPTTLGTYHTAFDEVWLSPSLFSNGTKAIVSCLYEELIHRETGKTDCNYDMQTYLFDKIISLFEEHVIQEPI